MRKERPVKAITELALIEFRANVTYSQAGYWSDLNYQTDDSAFKLERIISTQNPEIAAKLRAWGEKWKVI